MGFLEIGERVHEMHLQATLIAKQMYELDALKFE